MFNHHLQVFFLQLLLAPCRSLTAPTLRSPTTRSDDLSQVGHQISEQRKLLLDHTLRPRHVSSSPRAVTRCTDEPGRPRPMPFAHVRPVQSKENQKNALLGLLPTWNMQHACSAGPAGGVPSASA